MRNKGNRTLIAGALIAAVLAGAFWYGGGTPASRGWRVDPGGPAASGEGLSKLPVISAPEQPDPEDQSAEAPPAPAQPEEAPPAPTQPEEGLEERQAPAPETPSGGQEPPPETEPPLCTLSISCATLLDHMDQLDEGKTSLVPADGWVLSPTQASFQEGESAFQLLQRICREQGIHMESSSTPLYGSAYIEGIHNLYEFDCGELSGWVYSVNGWFPNYGCSQYALQEGDEVAWMYTCDLGGDVGGYNAIGG